MDVSTPTTTDDEDINAALMVLREERERRNPAEVKVKGDGDVMADETGQSQALEDNVDSALKILLHNAIEEFGFAPDVYRGVLHLPETGSEHIAAVKSLRFSHLVTIAEKFSRDFSVDDFAHRVVAVYPDPNSDVRYHKWEMDFKSARIAREAVDSMRIKEPKQPPETCNLLRHIRMGSILAERVSNAIAHQ